MQVYENEPAVANERVALALLVFPIPEGAPCVAEKLTLCATLPNCHVTEPPRAMSTDGGLNWLLSPAWTVAVLGNCGAVTVTVACANLVASAWEAARMSAVPAATADTRPDWSTVAIAALLVVQVTAFEALLPVVTVAARVP